MAKRDSRDNIDKTNVDLLKPIDILSLGSEDDPCFGKLHDLKAPECKNCGDSEFCAIVKAQGLHKERLVIETEQRFKDIEEAEEEMIKRKRDAKEKIEEYRKENIPRMKTIIRVAKEFNLSKEIVKSLYNQI